jgi:hypothetical protein
LSQVLAACRQATSALQISQLCREEDLRIHTRNFQSVPGTAVLAYEECPICREKMHKLGQGSIEHEAVRTTCGHLFGRGCLTTWLLDHESESCPDCRRTLVRYSSQLKWDTSIVPDVIWMAIESSSHWDPDASTLKMWGTPSEAKGMVLDFTMIYLVVGFRRELPGREFFRRYANLISGVLEEEIKSGKLMPFLATIILHAKTTIDPECAGSRQYNVNMANHWEESDATILQRLESAIRDYQSSVERYLASQDAARVVNQSHQKFNCLPIQRCE